MLQVDPKYAVGLLVLCLSSPVLAGDPGPSPEAKAHKAAGDKAFDEKRYADALAEYKASYDLVPTPSLLYNQGRALQFMGRYPEALALLKRFRTEAPPATLSKVPGLDALIDEIEGKVGTILVECETPNAVVMLGERKIGITPFATPIAVNAGTYDLEVRAEGRVPYKASVEIAARAQKTLHVELTPIKKSGVLVIRSTIDGTRVTIDGVAAGKTPVERVVSAGNHTVVVEAEGYDPVKTSVVVELGGRKETTLDPEVHHPGLLTRWWFWTGVGVVVVGGVTTYVVLTRERSPDAGSFAPGTISAGLLKF